MPPLTDRTLVVSGGSRGIGLAIELGLTEEQRTNITVLFSS